MSEKVLVAAKAWWKSKTFRVGALEFIVGAGDIIAGSPLFGDTVVGVVLVVTGLATVLLRIVTRQPLSLHSDREKLAPAPPRRF